MSGTYIERLITGSITIVPIDGAPIEPTRTDQVIPATTDADLILSGNGTGIVAVETDLNMNGNNIVNVGLINNIDISSLGGGGAVIDDVETATGTTWSSSKISGAIGTAQEGLDIKESVRVTSTVADSNQSLTGISTQLDGVSLNAGDRVLLRYQTNVEDNGLWTVVDPGSWIRPMDSNNASEIRGGSFCFVNYGTQYARTGWVLQATDASNTPHIIGTDDQNWYQFSDTTAVAGDGITVTGTSVAVNSSVIRTTGNQTITGNVVVAGSLDPTHVHNADGISYPTILWPVSALSGAPTQIGTLIEDIVSSSAIASATGLHIDSITSKTDSDVYANGIGITNIGGTGVNSAIYIDTVSSSVGNANGVFINNTSGTGNSTTHGIIINNTNANFGLAYGIYADAVTSSNGNAYGVACSSIESTGGIAIGIHADDIKTSGGANAAYGVVSANVLSGTGDAHGVWVNTISTSGVTAGSAYGVKSNSVNAFVNGNAYGISTNAVTAVSGNAHGIHSTGVLSGAGTAYGFLSNIVASTSSSAFGTYLTSVTSETESRGFHSQSVKATNGPSYGIYSNEVESTTTGNAYGSYFNTVKSLASGTATCIHSEIVQSPGEARGIYLGSVVSTAADAYGCLIDSVSSTVGTTTGIMSRGITTSNTGIVYGVATSVSNTGTGDANGVSVDSVSCTGNGNAYGTTTNNVTANSGDAVGTSTYTVLSTSGEAYGTWSYDVKSNAGSAYGTAAETITSTSGDSYGYYGNNITAITSGSVYGVGIETITTPIGNAFGTKLVSVGTTFGQAYGIWTSAINGSVIGTGVYVESVTASAGIATGVDIIGVSSSTGYDAYGLKIANITDGGGKIAYGAHITTAANYISGQLAIGGSDQLYLTTGSYKLYVTGNTHNVGNVSATGTITSGTITTTGTITGGTITTTGTITGGTITTTGTIAGGTITTTGTIAGGTITTTGAVVGATVNGFNMAISNTYNLSTSHIVNSASPGINTHCTKHGNYLYVCNSVRGILIYDITDPTNPIYWMGYNDTGSPVASTAGLLCGYPTYVCTGSCISTSGNYLYVCQSNSSTIAGSLGGIIAIGIASVASGSVSVGVRTATQANFLGIEQGTTNTVYAVGYIIPTTGSYTTQFNEYTVTSETSINIAAFVSLVTGGSAVPSTSIKLSSDKGYAYIGLTNSANAGIISTHALLQSPSSLNVTSDATYSLGALAYVKQLDTDGTYLYVAHTTGITRYNINQTTKTTLETPLTSTINPIHGVQYNSTHGVLYCADGTSDVIRIKDPSTLADITIISVVDASYFLLQVAGVLYVNAGIGGLKVINLDEYARISGSTALGTGVAIKTGAFVPTTANTDLGSIATGEQWNTIYATNATINTSDSRFKRDVVPFSIGMSFVNQLNPVTYVWNDDVSSSATVTHTRPHVGLIAQDVLAALESCGYDMDTCDIVSNQHMVDSSAEDRYSMRYSNLIMPLISAVKELSAKNTTLEARLEALEARI